MRLADLYDMLGEPPTKERIIGGSAFYVAPSDRSTRARIEKLRIEGYEITPLGNCRFKCKGDPISDTLRTDGKPFRNNKETAGQRYRLSRKGYGFRKLTKGVYICCKRPEKPSQSPSDAIILSGEPFDAGPMRSYLRGRITVLRQQGHVIKALGRNGIFVHERSIATDDDIE